MKYLLSTNRGNFNRNYRSGLSSNIYIPLNAGRYVGSDNQSSIFKSRPDTDSIKLTDWITNQITLGNIVLPPDENGIISDLPVGDVTINSVGNTFELDNTLIDFTTPYDGDFARINLTLNSADASLTYNRVTNLTNCGFGITDYTTYMYSDDGGGNITRFSITGSVPSIEGEIGSIPFSYPLPTGDASSVSNQHKIVTWRGSGPSVGFLNLTQAGTLTGYADDAAAATGGIGVGYIYYNTTALTFKTRMT